MKKDSFKVYFSNILSDKYLLNKEDVKKYWRNKRKQEVYEQKRLIGVAVGLGELLTATSLCVFDTVKDNEFMISVIILGSLGWITTKASVVKKNPYNLKRYKEIDSEYEVKKHCYKKVKSPCK